MLKNLEAGSCVSTPRYFPATVIRARLMDGHVHSSLCLHKLCFDRTPGSVYDSVYCRWAKPIVAFIQQGDRWGFFAEREWEITASTDKNARPWTETVKRCYCKINATPIQDNTEGSSVYPSRQSSTSDTAEYVKWKRHPKKSIRDDTAKKGWCCSFCLTVRLGWLVSVTKKLLSRRGGGGKPFANSKVGIECFNCEGNSLL